MSLRVRKSVGYGIVIPSEEAEERDWRKPSFSADDFLHYLQQKPQQETSYNLHDVIAHVKVWESCKGEIVTIVDEFGDEQDQTVLLITPFLVANEWHRSDDAIDYIELSLQADPDSEPKIAYIPKNPFPFTGTMDKLTGEKIPHALTEYLELATYVSQERLDELVRKESNSTYSSFSELQDRMVPSIPAEVRAIADYLNMLKPDEWKKLRPMLLTYWQ